MVQDAAAAIDQDSRNREYYDPVREWTTRNNFRFPPPLCIQEHQPENNDRDGVIYDRLHVIHEVPRMNTSLYCLLSQYNPWLDCEMTREKRAFLKPRPGEMCCAVYCGGGSSSQPVPNFFRNETVVDIVNLYLWPLLYSRADDVVACRTFADWRRLFARTISLAFPDYDYWVSIAAATSSSSSSSASAARFIPISDQRRTARILKYLTPARVLYLLTTRANLWPYGQTTSQSTRSSRNSGLCAIKPKIKEYSDKTAIEWLVSAEFMRKMKRVHMYFTPIITSASNMSSTLISFCDTDDE